MSIVNDGLAENASLIGSGLGGTKWQAMAIGSSSAAVAVTNRRLGSELDNTFGGGRKGTASVTKTLEDSGAGFLDTMRLIANWSFSGIEVVREFCVGNNGTADSDHAGDTDGGAPDNGLTLLRDVFDDDFNTQSADVLELRVDSIADDPTLDEVGQPSQAIVEAGITEMLKLMLEGQTADRFSHVAMDDSNTAAAQSQTALVSEFATGGLSRGAATVSRVTTNVTNDTTQFERQFSVTATKGVDGTGVFNDPTTGDMGARWVYASVLNLVNSDTFTQRDKIVQVAA